MIKNHYLALAAGILSASISMSANASTEWEIKDIGAFFGEIMNDASTINDSGQILGREFVSPGGGIFYDSFITGPNGIGFKDMGFSGSPGGLAVNNINDLGQAVGYAMGVGAFFTGPDGIGITYFGIPRSNGNDINNSGQVVGNAVFDGYTNQHAFITGPNGAGITDLGTLDGNSSNAYGVNNSGQVIGSYVSSGGSTKGFITDSNGTNIRELEISGGNWITSSKINDAGQVVGTYVPDGSGTSHAFVIAPDGGVTDLGTMGGVSSIGYSINNLGEVVGAATCEACPYNSFLYSHGVMVNLSQLDIVKSAGWSALNVLDINDHGQMAGYGFIGGAVHAFLLTRPDGDEFFNNYVPIPPMIPEPQTYTMLLAGLGLLGFMVLRRKKSAMKFKL